MKAVSVAEFKAQTINVIHQDIRLRLKAVLKHLWKNLYYFKEYLQFYLKNLY